MNSLHKYLALAALALMPSMKALAQDVVLDLAHPDKNERQSVWSLTCSGVRAEYIPSAAYSAGAYIYMDWRGDYDFKITSSTPIAVIELDGITDNRKEEYTSDVLCTTGTLKMHPNETSIWTGNSTSVSFYGWQRTTRRPTAGDILSHCVWGCCAINNILRTSPEISFRQSARLSVFSRRP